MILWTGTMPFWQPQFFFWQKADDLSQNVRKRWIFSHNDEILQNFRIDSENSVLTAAPKKNSTQSHNFLVGSRKCLYFVYLIFSIKMFRWTRKILFWQHRRNFSEKKEETFLLTVLKGWKTVIIWKIFTSWKYSHVHKGCSFEVPTEIFSTKGRNLLIFTQFPKRMDKIAFLSKKLFFLKIFWGYLWCSFENPTERNWTKRWKKEKVCSMSEKDEFFFKTGILQNFPIDT